MNNMLGACTTFNQDLSQWDVSNLQRANGLFSGCNEFNVDISKWNPASATNWEFLLNDATSFNQDLSGWKFPNGYRHWRNFFRNAKNMDKSRMPAGITNDGLPGCCSCPPHNPISNPWPESVAEYFEAKAAAAAAAEAAAAMKFAEMIKASYDPIEQCKAACAAEKMCCNQDIAISSHRELSCLQACHASVVGGISESTCMGECRKRGPSFNIAGTSYPAGKSCDDFRDFLRGNTDQCAQQRRQDNCETGCSAGAKIVTVRATMPPAPLPPMPPSPPPPRGPYVDISCKAHGTCKRTFSGDQGSGFRGSMRDYINRCTRSGFTEGTDCDLSLWDVSEVTNMQSVFNGLSTFNEDISMWDVRKCSNFNHFLWGARAFSQDLSHWDVSAHTNDGIFTAMFCRATAFQYEQHPFGMPEEDHRLRISGKWNSAPNGRMFMECCGGKGDGGRYYNV